MKPVKIGFLLLSNSRFPIPSTRISVLNMLPFLRESNYDPHIIYEPTNSDETPDVSRLYLSILSESFDIVYFQKIHSQSSVNLAKKLSAAGIRTVFGLCDIVDISMVTATDATIVVTQYLKNMYPSALQSKISVVHDGIEKPNIWKKDYSNHSGSWIKPINAVLVTSVYLDRLPILESPPEWLQVSIVGRYASKWSYQKVREVKSKIAIQKNESERIKYIKFLASRRIRCYRWNPVDVYRAMQKADIGIIPVPNISVRDEGLDTPNWKVKSENRLTLKMSLGLPVIASPVPSYELLIEQGENGYLAQSYDEWINILGDLREPKKRKDIGRNARESVLEKYSMRRQASLLINVLNRLL